MSILVLLEQRGGIRNCALEAASAAGQISKKSGQEAHGVLIGDSVESQVEKLAGLGLKKVHVYENEALKNYSGEGYVPLVQNLVSEIGAQVIIGSASAQGKEFCAALAGKLDVELAQDCIGLDWDNGVVAKKPVYAGKAIADMRLSDSIQFVSLRPNVFKVQAEGEDKPEIEKKDVPELTIKSKVVEEKIAEAGKVELTEAKIIVSGGRGLDGPDFFSKLQELCDQLGAALGASRAAVDAGWIPHSHQVGQTGKVVNPDVYIACGISGAIQHQAGMRNSGLIVAVNKEADADIFKICDYGIVGDLFEIVPLLTEEMKKAVS
jgi:electron transfer flavoprotein alpha subunit